LIDIDNQLIVAIFSVSAFPLPSKSHKAHKGFCGGDKCHICDRIVWNGQFWIAPLLCALPTSFWRWWFSWSRRFRWQSVAMVLNRQFQLGTGQGTQEDGGECYIWNMGNEIADGQDWQEAEEVVLALFSPVWPRWCSQPSGVKFEAALRIVPQWLAAEQTETGTRSVPGHRLPISICPIYPNKPGIWSLQIEPSDIYGHSTPKVIFHP
jgi:hypothetical protein